MSGSGRRRITFVKSRPESSVEAEDGQFEFRPASIVVNTADGSTYEFVTDRLTESERLSLAIGRTLSSTLGFSSYTHRRAHP